MPGFRGFLVLGLALPLAGCFSVTAPKEVPGWAMSTQVQPGEPRAKPSRRTPPRHRVVTRDVTASMPTQIGNAAMPTHPDRAVVTTGPRPANVTAFTPEWHAREDAAEAQLRRRMKICTGC